MTHTSDDNRFLLISQLAAKGYPYHEISALLLEKLPVMDIRSKVQGYHFDENGCYQPPLQVIAMALTIEPSPQNILIALSEFNLYWKERGELPAYAHQLFITHLNNRIKF